MTTPLSRPPGESTPPVSGPNPTAIIVILAGLAVIGGLIAVVVLSGGNGDDGSDTTTAGDPPATIPVTSTDPPPPSSTPDEPDPTEDTGDTDGLIVGPDTSDLARAAVLLLQLDRQGTPICFSGSGSVISPTGQILTNAHVVEQDPACTYDQLGVAFVDATDEPPSLQYLAEVVAFDEFLDLAVVQITTDVFGNETGGLTLPYVSTGDSNTVALGDPLRILGFPGIGGDTITFTRGAVSGFVAERGVDDVRAWIKTDATIAGGNSGGMAVNDAGELVAVPTTAGAGDADTTDCRVIEDTNGDGFIDDSDGCIPIGGFINGLRPVNLAVQLIEQSADGVAIDPIATEPIPPDDFDPADVIVEEVYFAPDVAPDDQPTEIVTFLPSGVDRVCAFWSYDGMRDGVTYDAIWRVDGSPDTDASFLDDVWAGGTTGEWWVCIVNDTGVADGLYEFEFTVEGEFLASESLFVGGGRQPVSITLDNQSADTICFVQISPTLSGYWGGDELGATEVIEPFGNRVFDDLVTGRYDIILRDCGLEALNEWFELDIDGDETIVHTG